MRIAVFEPDVRQSEFIYRTLSAAGHTCHAFAEHAELATALRRQTFDLLVLDWNIPHVTRDQVMRWVRENLSVRLPVLLMTNQAPEPGDAATLERDAGDYVTKPISEPLLLAHIDSLLWRVHELQPQMQPPLTEQAFGIYKFDLKLRQVFMRERPVTLTHKEYGLALLIFQHVGRALSRAQILSTVWNQSSHVPSRTVDTHMSMLRAKLQLRPENGYRLTPIYGYGYRLDCAQEDGAPGDEIS